MMNGCDHQPVQRNLRQEAIRVANELFLAWAFIHRSFEADTVQALEGALPEQLSTVTGWG